jgi:hypothetical protein
VIEARGSSEFQFMRLVVGAEGESSSKISLDEGVLAGLDVTDNGSINRFLCVQSFL